MQVFFFEDDRSDCLQGCPFDSFWDDLNEHAGILRQRTHEKLLFIRLVFLFLVLFSFSVS
jgi:hypothetical protein